MNNPNEITQENVTLFSKRGGIQFEDVEVPFVKLVLPTKSPKIRKKHFFAENGKFLEVPTIYLPEISYMVLTISNESKFVNYFWELMEKQSDIDFYVSFSDSSKHGVGIEEAWVKQISFPIADSPNAEITFSVQNVLP